jgi:4-carboxymuconolactone decarboxylase
MDETDKLDQRGFEMRKKLMGEAAFEQAQSRITPFTEEWMAFVTRYAFGEVWSRTALPMKTRSMLTIAMLTALGRYDELAAHIRATRQSGVSRDEVKEILMQAAIYAGVPAAMSAFHRAQQVFAEMDKEQAR